MLLHERQLPAGRGRAARRSTNGTIIARLGYVLLRVGDDVNTHQNSQILARRVDRHLRRRRRRRADRGRARPRLRHRHGAARPDHRRLHQPGRADLQPEPDPGQPARAPVWLTQIWGYDDIDQIEFGDPTGLRPRRNPKTTLGDPGYIFIGSKTIARGSDNAVTSGDAGHDPSIADGEDVLIVWYLQTADVDGAPAQLKPGRLDGAERTRRRPLADARRPGGHRLLRDLHDRQPRLGPQLRDQRARHRPVERRRRRARDLRRRQPRPGLQRLHRRHDDAEGDRRHLPAARRQVHRHRRRLRHRRRRRRVPTAVHVAHESADDPAFVALLHGDNSPDGGLALLPRPRRRRRADAAPCSGSTTTPR